MVNGNYVKQGEYYTVDGHRWKAEEPIRDRNGKIVSWKLTRMITSVFKFNDKRKADIIRTERQILELDADSHVTNIAKELQDSGAGHHMAKGVMNRRCGRR